MENESSIITGGCLCGAVRYQHDGPAGRASYCHCRDCRRVGGSAFSVAVWLERARFRVVAGQVKEFTKPADSGTPLTRGFCPDCGSPLYTLSPKAPEHVFVRAGSLDDPSVVRPAHQSWTASRVPWSRIDPALPAYPGNRGE